MRTLTWHQQRGVERARGLHRWIAGDACSTCLHCGESACDGARAHAPSACGPGDARLHQRDDAYRPHHWCEGAADASVECAYCGTVATAATVPASIPSCVDA